MGYGQSLRWADDVSKPATKGAAMTSVKEADERAIRALIDRQITGGDTADPDAYASVFAHARAAVIRPARRWNRGSERINTSIAVRTDGGWQLAASQNTTHRRFAEKLMGIVVSRRSHSCPRQGDRNA
jgi:hypothetical protein